MFHNDYHNCWAHYKATANFSEILQEHARLNSDIFRKAVHSVIRFARDYYKSRFDTEQVSDIKSVLNLFGDDRQSHQAAGDFLYFAAKQKGEFNNWEQIKGRREVDNVVEGNYDQQKRGFSMRR